MNKDIHQCFSTQSLLCVSDESIDLITASGRRRKRQLGINSLLWLDLGFWILRFLVNLDPSADVVVSWQVCS